MSPANLSLPLTEPLRLELPDADLQLWRPALPPTEADALFTTLRAQIEWQQEDILIFGERKRVPRLVAWHGDPEAAYTYSGTLHRPLPWTLALQQVRDRVEGLTGHRYNSVLLNLYRDGRDGMGWHADNEPELGPEPAIASLSLGATRRFKLRHCRARATGMTLDLAHGDLLLMAGRTQQSCVHSVPKTARPAAERINLTFRRVGPAASAGKKQQTR